MPVVYNHFGRIAAKLAAAPRLIGTPSAKRIATDASRRAPRLTGGLAGSARVSGSTVEFTAVNEEGTPRAGFVERGTSKMRAEPFLEPAVEADVPKVERDLLALLKV